MKPYQNPTPEELLKLAEEYKKSIKSNEPVETFLKIAASLHRYQYGSKVQMENKSKLKA